MDHKTNLIITAVTCLIVGGTAGYFIHPLIQPNTSAPRDNFNRTEFTGQASSRPGPGGRNGGNLAGERITGTIQSISDDRLTITTPDQNSQIIFLNDVTSYQHTVAGSRDDLSTNQQITITGSTNPDGSTTASSIQIMPESANPLPFGGPKSDQPISTN